MRTTILIIAAASTLTACGGTGSTDPNIKSSGSSKTTKNLISVTYKIGGTARKADLTYSTVSGQEQQGDARLPWTKTFKVKKADFTTLDVSAQNKAETGTVTCEIDVDGKKVKEAKSSGQYAVVSCDHSIGL
jgi:hypothetical protein